MTGSCSFLRIGLTIGLSLAVAKSTHGEEKQIEKNSKEKEIVRAYLHAQGKGDIRAGLGLAVGKAMQELAPFQFAHTATFDIKIDSENLEWSDIASASGFTYVKVKVPMKKGETTRVLPLIFVLKEVEGTLRIIYNDKGDDIPDKSKYADRSSIDVEKGVKDFSTSKEQLDGAKK